MMGTNLLLVIMTLQMFMSKNNCSPTFVVGLLNDTHLRYEREYLKAYLASAG